VPCPDVFVQDVPAFVRRKGLVFQDYLDARKPAVLDAEHCVRLNYEAFFFADAWERERFLSDPVNYCGLLTDPISRRRFRPTLASPRFVYQEVTYYFESEANRLLFEEAPEAHRLPGWKM
jgi:YHS domain-containing protein